MTFRGIKSISIVAALAAGGYLVAVLCAGGREVSSAMRLIGFETLAALALLSLCNYGLRYVRWHFYLSRLGHPLPWIQNLKIYLSGFALTATPGKAGELARTLWLQRLGVPANTSIAAFFAERILDLVAIVLLSFAGMHFVPQGGWALGAGVALICLALALLFVPALTDFLVRVAGKRSGKVQALALRLADVRTQARQCLRPDAFLIGLGLGVLAWGAECWSLWILMGALGHSIDWHLAVSIYALSMLAGAVSFLPGGLGGTEATMLILLKLAGVPWSRAVPGVLIIRLATLWFAMLLGLIALVVPSRAAVPMPRIRAAQGDS